MSLPSYKIFRPQQATLEEIRQAQSYVSYVIITSIPRVNFPFRFYGSGVYYVTPDSVYPVKDPAFLHANRLVKDDEEDFRC